MKYPKEYTLKRIVAAARREFPATQAIIAKIKSKN